MALPESALGQIRGKITHDAPLGASGWFKCGGTADVLFKPEDEEDLSVFFKTYTGDVQVFGALSNTIIRDGGVRGAVIRLGRSFGQIMTDHQMVMAGALALDANIAQVASDSGIGGLEFFSGIPGTIGGALRMNAGCYGRETKDVLVSCRAMDRAGVIHVLTPDDMHMTYRHVGVPDDFIFLSAVFKGVPEDPSVVSARMTEIKQRREAAQPIREKTGGSTFANPGVDDLTRAGLPPETKVWQLIEAVGGRGLAVGGAMMSEKHCNFMINTGTASASDLEKLGEMLITRVYERFGITLRWEIKRVGDPV
ncbi:MAG: UDP-N-acetylmuramate dehydrogenase [Alphaproteobacteria bacterium]|nr:UDP-N-acetylmuramate dehydrogenase [Alphaproteobacteria bacterium]